MSEIERIKKILSEADIVTHLYEDDCKGLHSYISILEEKVKELEIQLNQERKDKNAWLIVYQEKMRELEGTYSTQLLQELEVSVAFRERAEQTESRLKKLEYSLFELRGKYDARAKELYETEQSLKRLQEAVDRMKELAHKEHYYCEDCWYSCPKSEDGCCNDDAGENCNCGADEHNQKVEELYKVREEG